MRPTIEMRKCEFGYPVPTAVFIWDRKMHYRTCKAELLRFAAAVEEASLNEKWCVNPELCSDHRAMVMLETLNGTQEEAEAGLRVLQECAARWSEG